MFSDMKHWPAFNKVYVTYFPEGKRPARSAFGASGLALGGLIELECQALRRHEVDRVGGASLFRHRQGTYKRHG